MNENDERRMRGKLIGSAELTTIRHLIDTYPQENRTFISRRVCEAMMWFQPNGRPQDVACREILRRLEGEGLICLPAGQGRIPNRQQGHRATGGGWELPFETPEMTGSVEDMPVVRLTQVQGRRASRMWTDMMERHHYLGYSWSVGRSIKYLFYAGADLIGGMSWGSACWKLGSRDELIGWDAPTREKNLQGMAGNHRFLILPWVKVKNLASHLLSRSVKQLPVDWKERYGVDLYLLESFVDPSRFHGTCYKAANWIYLGQSKGSSKSGNAYVWHGRVKDIYVYPLRLNYREKLRGL